MDNRESRNGGKFKQYDLLVDVDGSTRRIAFLMGTDLASIGAEWGKESKSWIGKTVSVQCTREGKYNRWKIEPVKDGGVN